MLHIMQVVLPMVFRVMAGPQLVYEFGILTRNFVIIFLHL